MDDFSDSYVFNITGGGKTVELGAKSMSFTLSDSIYRYCPSMKLAVGDPVGAVASTRIFSMGRDLEFTFGTRSKQSTYVFKVMSYQVEDTSSNHGINGKIVANLIHSAKFRKREFECFDGNPANVFEKISKPFTSKRQSSACIALDKQIYNPNLDNEEFVETILAPVSLSTSNSLNPCYLFIDLANTANFVSYSDLLKRQAVDVDCTDSIDSSSHRAYLVVPYSQDLGNAVLSGSYTYIGGKSGELETLDFKHNDPNIPVVQNKNIDFKLTLCEDEYGIPEDLDLSFAAINHKYRRSMFNDKLVVSMPLTPEIVAGSVINLVVDLAAGEDEESSTYCGKYAVEASMHSWDAEEQNGNTTLIVGRNSVKIGGEQY